MVLGLHSGEAELERHNQSLRNIRTVLAASGEEFDDMHENGMLGSINVWIWWK